MRMRPMLKISAAALAGIALAAAALLAWLVRRPWPKTSGTIAVPGLKAPARIVRDSWGVPHIYAVDEHDLVFAQGYVHAQDRLWQMEFNRRVARGTLSAALGAATLEVDRFLRTIGLWRAAERSWAALDAETQQLLERYAAGVNAFIADPRTRLPLEFQLLKLKPEPWTPLDTLAWGAQMSWLLSDNHGAELLRAKIVETLGQDAAQMLLPPYPAEGALTIPPETIAAGAPRVAGVEALESLFGGPMANQGSNNWAIHGSRTASGKPILANDTHLYLQMPAIWYENGLHGGRFSCVGSTVPGVPLVIIGHNGTIAWGVTDMLPDVQDFYLEKLDRLDAPAHYEFMGEWRPLERRTEQIEVKGQAPVALDIYATCHGPLVNAVGGALQDVPPIDATQPLALAWPPALSAGSLLFKALLGINQATSWEEFRAALRDWDAPALNFVYADVDGNIGYQATGQIPIRAHGHQGLVPAPGWTGSCEWQGWIPYEELPSCLNPPAGFVATANNKIVGDDYPYHLAYEWSDPFRIQRICELLAANDRCTVEDVKALQTDTFCAPAQILRPYLLALEPQSELEAQALDELRRWNLRSDVDQPGAAIYQVWYRLLVRNTLVDKLGEELLETYLHYYWLHGRLMVALIHDAESPWFDDLRTPERETRDDIVRRSFEQALDWLSTHHGPSPAEWQWGRIHTIALTHRPLGMSGVKLLERVFNGRRHPVPGDDFTVNAGWIRDSRAFRMTGGTAQRLIVDLGDLDRSLAVQSTGQSGHALHPQREDLTALWARGEYHPLPFTTAAVERHARARLTLRPTSA